MKDHKKAYGRIYEKVIPKMLADQMIIFNDERKLFNIVDPTITMKFEEQDDCTKITITIAKRKN